MTTVNKRQPWREIYALVAESAARSQDSLDSDDMNSKNWAQRERAVFPREREAALAELLEERNGGKPWYHRVKASDCPKCLGEHCTCAVYEGG
jgi:hypothetical protein